MASDHKIQLKLLVNRTTKKVLFAEAGKDFVDFLFSLLAMPVGTVVQLTRKSLVGSFGKLYGSLEALTAPYIQPHVDKNDLLRPASSGPSQQYSSLLLLKDTPASITYYRCSSYCDYVTDTKGVSCPNSNCSNLMSTAVKFVPGWGGKKAEGATEGGGIGKGVVTYMVMDDLEVFPMSTITSITLLKKFQIKDVSALEDRVVCVGLDEGIQLLKASLCSTTVLTDVLVKQTRGFKRQTYKQAT